MLGGEIEVLLTSAPSNRCQDRGYPSLHPREKDHMVYLGHPGEMSSPAFGDSPVPQSEFFLH